MARYLLLCATFLPSLLLIPPGAEPWTQLPEDTQTELILTALLLCALLLCLVEVALERTLLNLALLLCVGGVFTENLFAATSLSEFLLELLGNQTPPAFRLAGAMGSLLLFLQFWSLSRGEPKISYLMLMLSSIIDSAPPFLLCIGPLPRRLSGWRLLPTW